jgi:hypothetical protein
LVEGSTPDISEYAQFNWYQYVWFHDPTVPFLADARRLAQWIGVAHSVGNPMTFWVLPQTCKVLARSTVWSLTADDKADPAVQALMVDLDSSIHSKIGDSLPDNEVDPELLDLLPSVLDDVFLPEDDAEYEPYEQDAVMPKADDYTPEAYDQYLTAEVLLPNMGNATKGKVTARKRDADGNPIGQRHSKPILDTREYEVEFVDGATATFTANTIAENMYSQVDTDGGRSYLLLSETIDHHADGKAVCKDDGEELTKDGQVQPRHTTQGWKLLVSWKDGSTSWVPLKDMKNSFPVELAEYALANKIIEEPAFTWWAKHVLRKRDCIIKKVIVLLGPNAQIWHPFTQICQRSTPN